MATRIATATGNFTAAATWATVDATSLLDSQAGNFTIATAATWSQGANFTPGVITIDAIAVKVATRAASPSGTMSVRLYNVTGAAAVAGTTVTINISDIQDDQGTAGSGFEGCSVGWVLFKFAAPVALAAATNYRVEAQSSAATQVNLFRDATANNMARMLRTTTTGAPAAGDNLFILKEWTSAATGTARTVTMDQTVNTDYGGASTTLAAFGIGDGCTLQYGVGAVNYLMRWSGLIQVWIGGTFTIGTVASPIPSTATAVLEFDCAATGDFGLLAWGTFTVQGVPRTAGKLVTYALLTADVAGGGTTYNVDTDTGWLINDEVFVSATTQTRAEGEIVTLSGGAGASSFGASAAAAAHGGSAASGVQAECALITRNVSIRSTLSTAGAYIDCLPASTVDIDWCRFRYMFGTATGKKGISVQTTTGSCGLNYATIQDVATGYGLVLEATSSLSPSWGNLNFVTCAGTAFVNLDGTGTTVTLSNIVGSPDTNSGTPNVIAVSVAKKLVWTNIFVSGTPGITVDFNAATSYVYGSWTGGAVHTAGGATSACRFAGSGADFAFTSVNFWRNPISGASKSALGIEATVTGMVCSSCKFFGNGLAHVGIGATGANLVDARFISCTFAGDSTFATPRGVSLGAIQNNVLIARFENCTFGVAAGIYVAHTAADIGASSAVVSYGEIILVNTTLGSATEWDVTNWQAGLIGRSFIARQRKDGSTNVHERVYPNIGTVSYDTATYKAASPSEKLAPTIASLKLQSGRKRVPVASGKQITVAVWVYKDGTYNGAQPRLICLANPAVGVTADVVVATATVAPLAWGQITGTVSPVAAEDGVLEFYVDCDGTAGAAYVDDWSATST